MNGLNRPRAPKSGTDAVNAFFTQVPSINVCVSLPVPPLTNKPSLSLVC